MEINPSIQQHKRVPAAFHHPMSTGDRPINRCLKIAPEERRYSQFEVEQSKILKEIMQKTNTKIEVTATKDGSLSFCIFGKEASLNAAINLILNDFQTPVTLTVAVPKTVHGRLLGPKGTRLAQIQEETQTKINMPRKEDESDIIRVIGLKNNAERAVQAIQKYVKDFVGKSVEKVTVERIYLLFITGAFNENLKRWENMGVKIFSSGGFLPSQNNNNSSNNNHHNNHNNNHHSANNRSDNKDSEHATDEVIFSLSGETEAVNSVKSEILQIYEEKKKKCTTVNIEVKKTQHKYILGPGGQNLRSLFAKTGVSVELPIESESETVTLRGELSKLGPALSELYSQAHSEMDVFFEVENWLHKYLIGQRKTNNIDFKARGVDVKSLDDKIKLHGPPAEVENIRDTLESELSAIKKTIIRKDIRVEPRIHGYIIGKQGATVEQIREESGAFILVPKADETLSEFITLEGTLEAVTLAEEKINAIAKKYEASRKLVIDQQLHGSIIGKGGEKIRGIREKFSKIVFTFPEPGSKSNEVTILGPTDEVEACYNYLNEFHKQLQENNHQAQVPIRNDVIKYIPDAQQTIKRIKVEHRVKIDLFIQNNNGSNSSALKSETKSSESTSNNNSNSNQAENSTSNATSNDRSKNGKGGKAAKKSQQQPQQKDQQQQEQKQSSQVRNGNVAKNINNNNISENYAVVIGKKEDVDIVKVKLSKLFDELATTTEFEIKMPHKLHAYLSPKGKLYRQLMEEFQHKIVISFVMPEKKSKQKEAIVASATNGDGESDANGGSGKAAVNGVSSKQQENSKDQQIDIVKIRGPKNIAKKAEKKFEQLIVECQEKVDRNYTAHVLVAAAIIKKFLYTDKAKINKLKEAHNVKIILPDKKNSPVQIVGYEKAVQAAQKEFVKLVKDIEERVEEKIEIPSQVHPRLIGAGGRVVKKLMEEFKVEVKFARQDDANPDFVTLFGKATNVEAAKNQMIKQSQHYMTLIQKKSESVNNNIEHQQSNNSPFHAPEISSFENSAD